MTRSVILNEGEETNRIDLIKKLKLKIYKYFGTLLIINLSINNLIN